ncbi:class I SAM-dependent methyltransferase [Schinkia sp. CFF1]
MALFDKSADTYDEWCQTTLGHFVDQLEKDLLINLAQPKASEVALDLGCGTGIYSLELAKYGLDVIGIDISSKMIKQARNKASDAKHKITFLEGDFHHLPFEDEHFDLVFTNITIEFATKPKLVICEAMRVLKKGGRFVAGFIGKNSPWGKMYQQKGRNDEKSVFRNASFFTTEEIKSLYSYEPNSFQYGLYLSTEDFMTYDEALKLEIRNGT